MTIMWLAYGVGGLGIAAMAAAPNVWIVGVLSAVEIGLILYGDVQWVAMMQELVPKELLGRVSSLVYLFAFALGPLGILAGGASATVLGTRSALLISGLVSGGICLGVLLVPGVQLPASLVTTPPAPRD